MSSATLTRWRPGLGHPERLQSVTPGVFLDVRLKDIDYCSKTRVLWLSAPLLSNITIIKYLHDNDSSADCLKRWSRIISHPVFRETFCKNCFQLSSGNNRQNPGDIIVGCLNILDWHTQEVIVVLDVSPSHVVPFFVDSTELLVCQNPSLI